ncbi:MAG: hypothetical protein J0M01_16625 [Dechloromonas sp.]|nr:hypothetical protein [Dechloromonas sp.]
MQDLTPDTRPNNHNVAAFGEGRRAQPLDGRRLGAEKADMAQIPDAGRRVVL